MALGHGGEGAGVLGVSGLWAWTGGKNVWLIDYGVPRLEIDGGFTKVPPSPNNQHGQSERGSRDRKVRGPDACRRFWGSTQTRLLGAERPVHPQQRAGQAPLCTRPSRPRQSCPELGTAVCALGSSRFLWTQSFLLHLCPCHCCDSLRSTVAQLTVRHRDARAMASFQRRKCPGEEKAQFPTRRAPVGSAAGSADVWTPT